MTWAFVTEVFLAKPLSFHTLSHQSRIMITEISFFLQYARSPLGKKKRCAKHITRTEWCKLQYRSNPELFLQYRASLQAEISKQNDNWQKLKYTLICMIWQVTRKNSMRQFVYCWVALLVSMKLSANASLVSVRDPLAKKGIKTVISERCLQSYWIATAQPCEKIPHHSRVTFEQISWPVKSFP